MKTELEFKTTKDAHAAGYITRRETSAMLAGSGLKIWDTSERGYGYTLAIQQERDTILAKSVEIWFTDEPNKTGRPGSFAAWFKREDVELAVNRHIKTVAAATLGKLGGASKSEAKIYASRENGKKGGRPRKIS